MTRATRAAVAAAMAIALTGCSGSASPTAVPSSPAPATSSAAASSSQSAPTSSATESPSAAGAPVAYEQACQAAAGPLVFWGGDDEASIRALFAVFSQDHPGIQLSYLSIGSDATQRLITQKAAGQPNTVDLLDVTPDEAAALVERGIVDESVDWKTIGVSADLINNQNAVLWDVDPGGLVYNTQLVKASDMPKTWADLLSPKWANGKIVVDPRGRPFDALSVVWGDAQTIKYVQQLKALKPTIIQGATAGMVAIEGGQAWIGTGGSTKDVNTEIAKGAPVAIQYLDVVPTDQGSMSLLTGAPDKNAALCFTGWLASGVGQQAIRKVFFIDASTTGVPATSTVSVIQTAAQATAVSAMSAKIAAIWATP